MFSDFEPALMEMGDHPRERGHAARSVEGRYGLRFHISSNASFSAGRPIPFSLVCPCLAGMAWGETVIGHMPFNPSSSPTRVQTFLFAHLTAFFSGPGLTGMAALLRAADGSVSAGAGSACFPVGWRGFRLSKNVVRRAGPRGLAPVSVVGQI